MLRSERRLVAGQGVLLASAAVVGVLASDARDWHSWSLFAVLLAVAVVSEQFRLKAGEVNISAAFLAIVLAMALLGPTPAAVVGVLAIVVSDLLRQNTWRRMLANVSNYAAFPLAGGIAFQALDAPALRDSEPAGFVLAVFALFLATNFLNFLLVLLDFAVVERVRAAATLRSVYLPVLPVECATALLTAGLAFAYQEDNLAVIGLLAVIAMVVQYLLRTALNLMDHREQLERRSRELAALQVGLLGTVLQTLSLRDKMTARHSAAVARYSREIAAALGLDDREQDVVHTAALLHDIGKFIFPDSILFADRRLSAKDLEIVRMHPEQGARLVARIDGYGPVADIVVAHHERIDGEGYPAGLPGDRIPLAARIISVADTYDVLTARDSYRDPISTEGAIAELRRVAGTQLDAAVVETFIALLERSTVSFGHGDDADFEHELNLERRVRDYAAPRATTV